MDRNFGFLGFGICVKIRVGSVLCYRQVSSSGEDTSLWPRKPGFDYPYLQIFLFFL